MSLHGCCPDCGQPFERIADLEAERDRLRLVVDKNVALREQARAERDRLADLNLGGQEQMQSLFAENDRLREALEKIFGYVPLKNQDMGRVFANAQAIARKALNPQEADNNGS